MDSDASGWLWVLIDIIMPLALLAVIVYGTIQWKKSSGNRAAQQVRDETTRENYRREESARRG
jgi:hypothetical protein